MRFSVMEWSSRPKDDDPHDYYRRLKALGYEAIELPSLDAARAVQAAGLKAANIAAPGFSDGLCRRENHSMLIPRIVRCIEEAAARRIEQVIVFSGDAQGVNPDEGLQSCIEGLKLCAAVAERLKITLIFEMFNTFDHPGYLAVSSRFGFDTARAVGSPHLRLLYDIYHMQRMGENVLSDLKANLEYVGHLHVAGCPHRDFPGPEQDIDYRAIVKNITLMGYQGYWGMEFYPSGDAYKSLEEARRLLLSYA